MSADALNSTGVRIGAFVAGLAVVFGAAFGIGQAVGPWDQPDAPAHEMPSHDMPAHNEKQVNR